MPVASTPRETCVRLARISVLVVSAFGMTLLEAQRPLHIAPFADPLTEARELRRVDPQAALARLNVAIDERTEESDAAELAKLVEARAELNRELGRLDAAQTDAERFRALAEQLGDAVLVARSWLMNGTIRAERGQTATALILIHEARSMLEEIDAPAELIQVFNGLGVVNTLARDYERAGRYYQRALELDNEVGDGSLVPWLLGNLAIVTSHLQGDEAGLQQHRAALALARLGEDDRAIAHQLGHMCERLVTLDRLEEAQDVCYRGLERLNALGYSRSLARTRLSVGDLHRKLGRDREAQASYEGTLSVTAGRIYSVEGEVLQKLADLHEERGEVEAALDYTRRLMAHREERRARDRDELVAELEVRYEVEQREQEIALLQLQSALQAVQLERRNWILAAGGLALALTVLLALVGWRGYQTKRRLERQLTQRNRELEEAVATNAQLAREDPLTGLLNRRAFLEVARHEHQRHKRDGGPLTVVVADIDQFKPINDRYGHYIGDQVLEAMAGYMRQVLRDSDVVCRWGGEEFVLLLPNCDAAGARRIAEALRGMLAESPIPTDAGPLPIRLSFGVAAVGDDLEGAIEAADEAMYQAKGSGRDRIVESNREVVSERVES